MKIPYYSERIPMKATEAAMLLLFMHPKLEEWPGGLLPLMAQRPLEDERSCLIAVGQHRALMFVDRNESALWYAWSLEREFPSIDDALIFLEEIREYTSLAEYMALGFELYSQRRE